MYRMSWPALAETELCGGREEREAKQISLISPLLVAILIPSQSVSPVQEIGEGGKKERKRI